MKHALIAAALCIAALNAFAACSEGQTVTAFGRTFPAGGALGWFNENCDTHEQPSWLAKINETPGANGTAPGLVHCRQIVRNKDPQFEAQRRDCIFWYGHSIEVP